MKIIPIGNISVNNTKNLNSLYKGQRKTRKNLLEVASSEVDKEETQYAKDKAREISSYIESLDKDMSVEEIQDIVVNKLMASSRKDVATKYVEYRYLHKIY